MSIEHQPLVIIGAGPAGLAAAHEAVQRGLVPLVLEKSDKVGGLARTETYKGYRFDVGGHRFYTKIAQIGQLWSDILGEDLIRVPRLSRIYYQGRFFAYPLELFNALSNLGLVESVRILVSYCEAQLRPYPDEETFEQWVSNRFGRRLYRMFFQAYTEKVWGIPCNQIQADWAAQRIKGLSLRAVLANVLFGTNNAKTLINEFHYPILGPGMMWERFGSVVEAGGGRLCLNGAVTRLERDGTRIRGLVVEQGGRENRLQTDNVISSMPLADLIAALDPLPPGHVVQAAGKLRHRDFVLVGLIVNGARPFPDNWIYIHSPEVRVGRIQNFKNWSAAMAPEPGKSNMGMEYFCTEGDDLWQMADADLIDLAADELSALGLVDRAAVEDGFVVCQPKAYPVYDSDYRANLQIIRQYLATVDNLQTIGRNGMHRYNNMDHSMLTGIQAVENLFGAGHDIWEITEVDEYLEAGRA